MHLTLRLVAVNGKPADSPLEMSFSTFPVVIGRSKLSDFVLDDPSKYISSKHATFLHEGGQALVKDTSSNGTYINGATESVGHSNTAVIINGDLLSIGDYSIEIGISISDELVSDRPTNDFTTDPSALTKRNIEPLDPLLGEEHDWAPPSKYDDDQWGLEDSSEPVVIEQRAETVATTDEVWDKWLDTDETPKTTSSVNVTTASPDPFDDEPFFDETESAKLTDDSALDWLPDFDDEPVSGLKTAAPLHEDLNSNRPSTPTPESADTYSTPQGIDPALEALARGAQINPEIFSTSDSQQVLELAGMILNKSLEGIMLLLHSRAEMKNAIRTDVTRLARNDNNPLKFSPDTEDALIKLLMPDTLKGYQHANEALNEAMDDLKTHQLAMLDGMKAAVHALLVQFDPDILQRKLEAASPIVATIPITRQAKLWQLFNDRFNDIQNEAMNDFNDLFGKEFRKAYNRRIRELGRKPD